VRVEINSVSEVLPIVVNNHLSVQAAANISGYSLQYLRRLLRNGTLDGMKIGQVWPIDKTSFDAYVLMATHATDRRFGSQQFFL